MKGLFIVIEGIDCSGKSTQAQLLKDYFISRGEKAILSPEPSSGPIGNLIREILKQRITVTEERQRLDEQMAYLFAADRHDHLYNDIDGVFKLVSNQTHVISTRYYFSSLAYNCPTPEDFEFVSRLNQKFPNPDLLIYLEISVDEAMARLNRKGEQQEIYENSNKLTLVSQNYQKLLQNYPDKLLRIDGSNSLEFIHQTLITFVEDYVVEINRSTD